MANNMTPAQETFWADFFTVDDDVTEAEDQIPIFWVQGDPELINCNSTEYWMLFEQIKDGACTVTDCGYETQKMVHADAPDKVIVNTWWEGTVITPGGDHYRMKSKRARPSIGNWEGEEFTKVEKVYG